MGRNCEVSNTVLKHNGMRILGEHLGLVEAERFISLIISEPFDYTEWQRDLFSNMKLDELCKEADEYWKETHD